MESSFQPLPVEFYNRDGIAVARDLLGRVLCHDNGEGLTAGMIVETEAYLSRGDPACHAARGKTARNAAMFGPAGRAYIYFIYGNHYCFNAVTGPPGMGEAVLIRALEPIAGRELMARRRGCLQQETGLTNGPGKLCQALGINGSLNRCSLQVYPLWIGRGEQWKKTFTIIQSPRVGISRGTDKPWRFYLGGNRFVSATRGSKQGKRGRDGKGKAGTRV